MKIEINIEKKHFYVLCGLFIIMIAGVVIAAVPEGHPFHKVLYVDSIEPASQGGKVTIKGEFCIAGPSNSVDGANCVKSMAELKNTQAASTSSTPSTSCTNQCTLGYNKCKSTLAGQYLFTCVDVDGCNFWDQGTLCTYGCSDGQCLSAPLGGGTGGGSNTGGSGGVYQPEVTE